MYISHRRDRALLEVTIVEAYGRDLLNDFAGSSEVDPSAFEPVLIPVLPGTREANLFRLATLLWSIPVSRGYGRRMRYLVRDLQNGKIVGIFALGDPVFNLKARDEHIGWNPDDREARLYHVLDAYVLGAVPPYSFLLGGKIIALMVISDEVRKDFASRYRGNRTVINRDLKQASLVLVTTTSALGRSSIYNRLRIEWEEKPVYRSVGYTTGYGHFHISDHTFHRLRDWLRSRGDKYSDGHAFGSGPNWRLRTIRRAVDLLGFNGDFMKHGVQREVFLAPLAPNYREFLRGEIVQPRYYHRSLSELVEFAKRRWLIPRSSRNQEWRSWTREDTWNLITSRFQDGDKRGSKLYAPVGVNWQK